MTPTEPTGPTAQGPSARDVIIGHDMRIGQLEENSVALRDAVLVLQGQVDALVKMVGEMLARSGSAGIGPKPKVQPKGQS